MSIFVREYLTPKDPSLVFRNDRISVNFSQIDIKCLNYNDNDIKKFKMSVWQQYLSLKADKNQGPHLK